MNIFLSGATGKMGQMLTDLAKNSDKYEIVAGFAAELDEASAYPIYLDLHECQEVNQIDVIIDFSSADSLTPLLEFALQHKIPIVIASTGFTHKQETQIREAAQRIPVLHAKNMSLGVNVMQVLVEDLAAMLPEFDIEIVEKHHRYKVDSPSGTAKMLYESANKGREDKLVALEGRAGIYDGRKTNEVGISSLRGGTIVGEHSVIFAGEDEVIEVKHISNSRAVFANGALKAAEFIIEQTAGFYDMNDVLK